jgi:hypothetical protein
MTKRMSVIIATLATVIAMTACNQEQQPVQATVVASTAGQIAPVVVTQPSNDGFFTGLLMRHLMSGGGSSRSTTVINKSYTTVNRSYSSPRTSYSRPSYSYSRSSSFGSFRSGRR